jgi:hypothetical protein
VTESFLQNWLESHTLGCVNKMGVVEVTCPMKINKSTKALESYLCFLTSESNTQFRHIIALSKNQYSDIYKCGFYFI